MAKTPANQLSLKLMRARGYYAETVEKYNPFIKRSNDFAGFIDILCLGDGEIIGVQTTSRSHISTRLKKIREHENLPIVLDSGMRVIVQGWAKNKSNRWEVKEVEVKFVMPEEPEENAELTESLDTA
jgi:hypothetical protein